MRYPIELDVTGRVCLIVGGGRVAARKAAALLACGARVKVLAPQLGPELASLREQGAIEHIAASYAPGIIGELLADSEASGGRRMAGLVFAATDDAAVNEAVAAEAHARQALVNSATDHYTAGDSGRIAHSDFTVPATLRRGRLSVSIATEGLSPALARALRLELERELPESLGDWLERLARLRGELRASLATQAERQAFWRRALAPEMMTMIRDGQLDQAEELIRNAAMGPRTES